MSEQKAAIERNGEATLLVVDDEPEIVALLDEYFTGLGYRVLTAEDGATALKRAEQSPTSSVLDVGMRLWTATPCAAAYASTSPALSCFSPHASRTSTRWRALKPVPTTTC